MAVLLAAIVSPGRAEERQSSVTVYASPEINLGEIDREIIDQSGRADTSISPPLS